VDYGTKRKNRRGIRDKHWSELIKAASQVYKNNSMLKQVEILSGSEELNLVDKGVKRTVPLTGRF
jgi:hypothetical protein